MLACVTAGLVAPGVTAGSGMTARAGSASRANANIASAITNPASFI
jgi:hypothetical protein